MNYSLKPAYPMRAKQTTTERLQNSLGMSMGHPVSLENSQFWDEMS
jgi:hypothetical protein